MKTLLSFALLYLLSAAPSTAAERSFDVVVIGGTPAGVMAAVNAARLGHTVALTEYHPRLGGMTSNGLGKSDVETREAIGGLFKEFVERVYRHYVDTYGPNSENVEHCRDGYYYEPSVAEKVFSDMVAGEPKISVFRNHRLEEVIRRDQKVVAVRVRDRGNDQVHEFRGRVFVDATYEGDLAAYAGVPYRLGREAREEFNELHAGVLYQDHNTRAFLAGTTGQGDRRLSAYTYRLCLTEDASNSVPLNKPPPDYDRTRYLGYLDDLKEGRLGPPRQLKEGIGYYSPHFNTMVRVLSFAEIPNKKFDVNMNPRPLGFPFAEENYDYPEANWEKREEITARLRNITLGLLYFIQNDPAVAEEHRQMARQYHLPKDEFAGNGHFPYQVYIREARRIKGEYTLTEHDVIPARETERTPVHADSIAAGEFPIDAFPVRKREPGHNVALEGYVLMLDRLTRPYQIPYRIMVPLEVDALLVPVAASTTHVAFSTIRMEPTWMAMGQAAGAVAHLALEQRVAVRELRPATMQRLLLDQGQVLTYFKDIDKNDPAHDALQYFGTKGFFSDYQARSREPITRSLAARWIHLALTAADGAPGTGAGKLRWADFGPKDENFAEASALALAGVFERPRRTRNFEPQQPLTRGEFLSWLAASGALLGLWDFDGDAEATLRAEGLAPESWTDPANHSSQAGQPLWRGELCHALFQLLEKAGF